MSPWTTTSRNRGPGSDQAASQVLDFLYDLIADFESAYAAQILRHRHAQAQDQRDRRQLPLFTGHDGDPF